MVALAVRGAHRAYGGVRALDGADLDVAAGELVAVLGPSGCGKTTLLRCVAGFVRLDAGEIRLGDRQVAGPGAHTPPDRRRIAVVPQEGALFPHLSVAGNVAYGLDRAARRTGRVDEVLDLVGLAGYGDRMPHQLSGGQQQRVAVARALAPRPPLVLLDEPFSALDAGLRADLRRDVRAALRAVGATAILVTHDQGEALSTADRVAVMHAGRIVQSGTPVAVYRAPATPWVAAFVGDAVLLPGTATAGSATTPLGHLPVDPALTGPVTVLLRPEQLRLTPTGRAAGGAATDPVTTDTAATPALDSTVTDLAEPDRMGPAESVRATVVRRDFHGHDTVVGLTLADGTAITARILDDGNGARGGASPGDRVTVRVEGAARAWPA